MDLPFQPAWREQRTDIKSQWVDSLKQPRLQNRHGGKPERDNPRGRKQEFALLIAGLDCSLIRSAASRLVEAPERRLEGSVLVHVTVCVWGMEVQLCMDGADNDARAERAPTTRRKQELRVWGMTDQMTRSSLLKVGGVTRHSYSERGGWWHEPVQSALPTGETDISWQSIPFYSLAAAWWDTLIPTQHGRWSVSHHFDQRCNSGYYLTVWDQQVCQ